MTPWNDGNLCLIVYM